jgi:hypothetical protein
MTTKDTYHINIDNDSLYGTLLDKIYEYMETGRQTLASANEILESVKIMLAGKVSRENNGVDVCINNIPEGASFDGYLFEKEYAKASSRLYL